MDNSEFCLQIEDGQFTQSSTRSTGRKGQQVSDI